MKPANVPNSEPDQQHLAPTPEPKLQFNFGLIGGVPLDRETLTLIAMKRLYMWREEIVREVAFNLSPEFINTAQEITQALLIVEKLLHDSGIRTELADLNPRDPVLRYTFLQVADDVLQSNSPIPAIPEHLELLSAVNKQFRPWVKPAKAAAIK